LLSIHNCVNARCVDLVLVPETPRQTLGSGQFAFALDEQTVDAGNGRGSERRTAICISDGESFLVFTGTSRKSVRAVLNRGEVQIRRHVFLFGRKVHFFRIGSGGENTLFDFQIAFFDIVSHLGGKLLEALHVGLDGVGKIGEIKGQQVRVGEPQDHRAVKLRESAAVDKVRVAIVCVPVKIVINRMLDAASVFAAETGIDHGNTEKILEAGVIGTAA
jgi:hypothetical protein